MISFIIKAIIITGRLSGGIDRFNVGNGSVIGVLASIDQRENFTL